MSYENMLFGAAAAILWPWGWGQENSRQADPEFWHCGAAELTLEFSAFRLIGKKYTLLGSNPL